MRKLFDFPRDYRELTAYAAPLEGRYVVEVKKWRRPRSTNANRLLWMWYNCIAKETGKDPTDIHEYCKSVFCPRMELWDTKIRKSTTRLDSAEFTRYLDQIEMWARDTLDITLPRPDGIGWDSFVATYGGN